jgi:hypothetical protein
MARPARETISRLGNEMLDFELLNKAVEATDQTTSYPVVVVDEEHSGFERDDGSTPPAYRVEPCDGLVVDSSAYTIIVPPQYKVDGPNMIHVLMGEDRQYRTAWSTNEHRHILSLSTLRPRPGSQPFRGFRSGDTVIIAIGFDHTGIDPRKPETLSLMWMGMVKIQ